MIRTGTLDAAKANRRHHTLANGTGYWRSDLIAGSAGDTTAPQAFLVEQEADSVILPHFHVRDQFQVVVNGEGSLGRHAVRSVSVHYAARHTGYGPITSGTNGLWYLSLRPQTDPGAKFLPEARGEMQPGPRLNLLTDPVEPGSAPTQVLLEPRPDGIAAWMLHVEPGASAQPPAHPGGGRYYIVVAGEMHVGETRLPQFSAAYVTADEEDFALRAGADGLDVLALQFARAPDSA